MTDARTALRSLLVYAICIPLAFVLGYLLANPLDYQGLTLIGIIFLVLLAPLAIHYHYPFMLVAWNMGAVVPFMSGKMDLWMVAVAMSFAVSFSHRILNKNVQFLSVPTLTKPLICLAVVLVVTVELRGGFSFRLTGGDTVGSRRAVVILMAIIAYFALTTRPIPRERARRYLGFFILGTVASAVSVLYGRIPSAFNFIFHIIPPSSAAMSPELGPDSVNLNFFRAFGNAGGAVFGFLMARYGLREIFSLKRPGLFALFWAMVVVSLLSGSRLALVFILLAFGAQFWLEGLMRSRLVVAFALIAVLVLGLAVPFATKLPLSIQRSLSVLPIKVDPIAAELARDSSEWRIQIWRAVVPQIPQYLLLGKGFSISRRDLSYMIDPAFAKTTVETRGATIAGDYHNGPLSVIIPLGLWGALAFIWFLLAGLRVLTANYRHGAAELKTINTYLLGSYAVSVLIFFFVFGALESSLLGFTGVLGLSVALNGGVARPEIQLVPVKPARGPGSPKPSLPRPGLATRAHPASVKEA